MRYFPSAARQRLTASVVGLVSLAALAIPFAHADDDDLLDQQREVKGRIDNAAHDLEEASKDASRASAALERAEARLGSARTTLANVTERLVAAREREAELKVEVAQAEAALRRADRKLAAGRQAVEDQKSLVRSHIIEIYTQGDPELRALGALLSQGTLEDISRQQVAQEVIVDKGTRAYDDLTAAEDALVEHQAEFEEAAGQVEAKRREAADHLTTMRGLYDGASAAEADVESLVGDRRTARQQALRAKARDRAVVQQLKQREARIKQRLIELAKSQEKKAGFTGTSDGYLSYPTNGPVTSPYGYRVHPIYGYYSLHNGIDFGVGCGQGLFASANGTVIDRYYDSVYGNRLFLSIGNVNGKNLVLIYNHMAGFAASEGEQVQRGDVVGYAGSTGWSTGCHLHFTVMADGVAVDPMTYL